MIEGPNLFCTIALIGWIPLVVILFAFLPPRRAVIYGYLISWLFLPMAHMRVHGLTDYNKMSAAGFGVLISSLIFDSGALFSFRLKIADLPMLVWCLCPFFSSLENGLGVYDGLVSIVYQTTIWGLPYLIGRIYFNNLAALRELAVGIVSGGLIYAPLCWFEIRFSPQLHYWIYGFHPQEFAMSYRLGGWRPMLFMQHGLAVGMWMAMTAVTAFWLYVSGTRPRVMHFRMGTAFLVLLVTTYFCHSLGATILMLVGILVLAVTYWTRWPGWILILAMMPPMYMATRATQVWTGNTLIRIISTISNERASSLAVRLWSEDAIVAKALDRPVFGWGGWDRFRATTGTPDALWIIATGHNGLVGLISVTLAQLLPVLLLARKIPIRYWAEPAAAPAAALAVLLILYLGDNLMNAMVNPIFFLGAGGICGLGGFLPRNQAVSKAHSMAAQMPAMVAAVSVPAIPRSPTMASQRG